MAEEPERRRQLDEAMRLIVNTRERTPRNPRWSAAWRRTLLRYAKEWRRLEEGAASDDAAAGDE